MDNREQEAYVNIEADAEYNAEFRNPQYDLEERPIPHISSDFLTPMEVIKNKFKHFNNNLTSFHINAGSIPKHYDEIVRVLDETGFNILCVSETFVCEKTPKIFYEIPGYSFVHRDRNMKCRGGTGLYIKNRLNFKEIKLSQNIVQPEICFIEIKCQFAKVAVGVVYKTPLVSYTEYSVLTGIYHVTNGIHFIITHYLRPFDLISL